MIFRNQSEEIQSTYQITSELISLKYTTFPISHNISNQSFVRFFRFFFFFNAITVVVKGRSAVELLLLLLLLRFVAAVIVVDVSPDQHYYPDHYPLRRSFGSDPPDPVMKGLRREKEAEAKVLCGCLIVDPPRGRPLPPLFVARRSNDGSLKCHNRENASATAQRDRSHCPCGRGSAVARTLARLLVAWGWVKSRVFGDHVKWVWHDL